MCKRYIVKDTNWAGAGIRNAFACVDGYEIYRKYIYSQSLGPVCLARLLRLIWNSTYTPGCPPTCYPLASRALGLQACVTNPG